MTVEKYNPLAIESLANSIVQRLMDYEPKPIAGLEKFFGAGLYAIYYTGDSPLYEIVKNLNSDGKWGMPIYVGKAVPKGSRKGISLSQSDSTTAIWERLGQHARSIDAVSNLNVADFYARWLVVDEIWIALGESALLRDYAPVWNAKADGFGNKDPGKGRHEGLVPKWDTLHPGRPWADKLKARPEGDQEAISSDVIHYLQSRYL